MLLAQQCYLYLVSGDDASTNDNDSIPDLVPCISDSDSDDEEGDIHWTSTGSGDDNILPTDEYDDDESIGILITDVDEVGNACSSRALVDLSNDSDSESDMPEEVVTDQIEVQSQDEPQLQMLFHPHDIVDRDGLETRMVSTNIFRAFNRSGVYAREFIRYITRGCGQRPRFFYTLLFKIKCFYFIHLNIRV